MAVAIGVVGVGVLLSITGADESGTIGTSRLAYAMSLDGFLPKAFSRRHGMFRTPYIGLTVLCIAAYVASLVGGLAALINASVFLLAVAYLATCLSAIRLAKRPPRIASELHGKIVVPIPGGGVLRPPHRPRGSVADRRLPRALRGRHPGVRALRAEGRTPGIEGSVPLGRCGPPAGAPPADAIPGVPVAPPESGAPPRAYAGIITRGFFRSRGPWSPGTSRSSGAGSSARRSRTGSRTATMAGSPSW